jgi:hypothetical protein
MRTEFEAPRIDVRDLNEAGDQELAAVTLRGRGKRSAVETDWHLGTFGPWRAAWSYVDRHSRASKKPSMPPGCGSRPHEQQGPERQDLRGRRASVPYLPLSLSCT